MLRTCLPTFPYERRISKIDTLRLAIAYLALLRDMLSGLDQIPPNDLQLTGTKIIRFMFQRLQAPDRHTHLWYTSGKIFFISVQHLHKIFSSRTSSRWFSLEWNATRGTISEQCNIDLRSLLETGKQFTGFYRVLPDIETCNLGRCYISFLGGTYLRQFLH